MEKIIVIGAGMAACKFAMELAQKSKQYHITLLSNEAVPSYNRIMLSPLLAKETEFENIILHDNNAYQNQGIVLRQNVQVVAIDRQCQCVVAANDECFFYDKLVIATGSKPFLLPLQNIEHDSVVGFRTLNDVKKIQQCCAKDNSHCVVVGAGLLGLEAASALAKQGVHATVVHRGGHILSQQLTPKAAHCLQKDLQAIAVNFHLHANVVSIEIDKQNQLQAVHLDNGKRLPCDCLVMAIGIKPEITLAKQCGLKTNKGICVSATMQTSDERIFAIGECTEFEENCFGLVAPVYQQALTLAGVLANKKKQKFSVESTATKLKVSGIDVYSAGDISNNSAYQYIEYKNPVENHYKRLSLLDGKIVGVVLYGDVFDGPWYFELMQQGQDVSPWRNMLIFGKAYCLLKESA